MRRRSILLIAQGSSALVVVALVAAAVASTGAQESEPRVAPERLRVVSYNIRHGAGMDGRVDLDRIAEVITRLRPDLVALQEIDRGTERTDRVDQAVALGRASGLEARFGAFMSYQGGEYGMAVLSRWPILETRNHRLPDGDEPRTALTVAVRSPRGTELVFGGIHLYRTEAERLAQAQQLFDALADESRPLILAGDFNSRPCSPVLDLLARRWSILDKGADRLTFPSDAPDREIDFVMLAPQSRFRVVAQRVVDEPVASDYRPLFVELELQ